MEIESKQIGLVSDVLQAMLSKRYKRYKRYTF